MCIKQIKVGYDNFSYIIYDIDSKLGAIVDPSYDINESLQFLKDKNLELKYIINTHHHNDHTNKNKDLKKLYPNSKLIISKYDIDKINLKADIKIEDDNLLKLGNFNISFISTPGHTKGGICILLENYAIFTGDTLFIGNCGRADLPGGDIDELFKSLQKIKKLSNELIVYPGHDYGKKPYDILKNQKKENICLIAKNIDEFLKIP